VLIDLERVTQTYTHPIASQDDWEVYLDFLESNGEETLVIRLLYMSFGNGDGVGYGDGYGGGCGYGYGNGYGTTTT